MIRFLAVLLAAILMSAVLDQSARAASPVPPNFVFILVDDQAWSGTSVAMIPGEPRSRTALYHMPNLDRLAAEGMTFSQAYAPHPKCEGTRYSLQFGKTTTSLNTTDKWVSQIHARPENSMINSLKRVAPNYRAAHFGKWQLVYPPEQLGFDLSDGITQNEDGDSPDPQDPKRLFSMTRRATAFVEQQARQKRPFFRQLSYYAVHNQPQALATTLAKYSGTTQARPGGKGDRAVMAAMAEDLDTCIGKLLEAIAALTIANNTYVIYMSDNGGRNAWLQGGKTLVWEGGIRVPLIVRGPGVKAGTYSSVPVVGYDIMPTALDLARPGTRPPPGVEGGSWKPVLLHAGVGKVERPIDRFVFHHAIEVEHPQSAIPKDDFKLLYYWDTHQAWLFNVALDPGESQDFAQQRPEVASSLEAELKAHVRAGLGEAAYAALESGQGDSSRGRKGTPAGGKRLPRGRFQYPTPPAQ